VSTESVSLTLSHLVAQGGTPLSELSIGDLLHAAAAEVPDRPAVIRVPSAESPLESVWTYRELLERSEDLARRLLVDFRPGDNIGVWATNKPEWILLQLAAALSGLVLVTLNPANRIEEMRYLLKQSRACGLFLDRRFRKLDNESMLEELRPDLPALQSVVFLDEWEHYLAGPRNPVALPEVSPASAALILFTSGTTGKPKGVVLSHRGVVNNALCALERYELEPGSVWLSVLPFFHVGGSVTNTLTCIANQGTHAVMSEFNPEIMLRSIEAYRANISMGVPVMVHAMLDHERFAHTDLSSLQLFLTGGTTVAPALVQAIREQFKTDVGVTFGQTEAGGSMCVSRRGDSEDRLCNTVGTPIASYEMKIVDPAFGQTLPVGQVGEICVRSPSTMTEYFDMPEQTAQTCDTEGWIRTGDLGVMRSDGYVAIAGRLKDMVIRGGENIYPREIEDTLIGHPSVAQVIVFGVPDEKWGEQLAAAVIVKTGLTVTGEQLAEFLGSRIARHKTPKYWSFVTSFPTNPTGKVQKFVLREQFLASHAAENAK
jgi:fatty-acyl-CoA synthase